MKKLYSLKIDVYSHIAPLHYKEALTKVASGNLSLQFIDTTPPLYDLEHRFRIMDKYEGLVQVLTLAAPPVEYIASPQNAADLAKLANDEMAELVFKYPDRFLGAVACLPMNDMDAALKETDRAINDLRFRGVQIYTNINGKPIDSPEFMPLYEKMAYYNLPLWIHPVRGADYADYKTEDRSMYGIFSVFGWPYETTVAMARLVFSGILEKYAALKVITHHCGAMVPYFEKRIIGICGKREMYKQKDGAKEVWEQGLTQPVIEYFKKFYNDTAIYGSTPGLMCAYAFCGADHLLFGTDMPLGDCQLGDGFTRQTINSIEEMDISDEEKKKIFEKNACRLLRLPI